MPISCHFRDCKALLVTSLTHVSSAIASIRSLSLPLPLHGYSDIKNDIYANNHLKANNCLRTDDTHLSQLSAACSRQEGDRRRWRSPSRCTCCSMTAEVDRMTKSQRRTRDGWRLLVSTCHTRWRSFSRLQTWRDIQTFRLFIHRMLHCAALLMFINMTKY